MKTTLEALVNNALAAIDRNDHESLELGALLELLKRYRMRRDGIPTRRRSTWIWENYGVAVQRQSLTQADVAEIVALAEERLGGRQRPPDGLIAILADPEDEVAVDAILRELPQVRPNEDPHADIRVSMLVFALRRFAHREDVHQTLVRVARGSGDAAELAQKILDDHTAGFFDTHA